MSGRRAFGHTEEQRKLIEKIKRIRRTRKNGYQPSMSAIARQLNREGHLTGAGKKWRAQSVKAVLNIRPEKKKEVIKKTSLETDDFLSKEQIEMLFSVINDLQERTIIATLLGAGLRASELCSLQVRDLGIQQGKCQIDVQRGKGAKQRSVFISKELSEMLRHYLDYYIFVPGKYTPVKFSVFPGLNYKKLYRLVKRLGQEAGLPRLHPHSLRHTFGTLLYHYRKDLFFVKEQLGHSKVETTQIYAKTLTQSKLEQMEAFGSDLATVLNIEKTGENTSKRTSAS